MQYKARLALYCITAFESRSIKNGLFIESFRFQRPRGRYLFFDTCTNLGQLFQHNFKNVYIHVPESSIENSGRSYILWNYLRLVLESW
jgi:hypothetical protein